MSGYGAGLPPEDRARLTAKQLKAMDEADDRVQNITGTDLGMWHIAYGEETHPGRGHDITAWAADGEHMATQYLDPYGSGPLVLCAIDVLHNDADEDHFDENGDCEHERQP